MAHFRELFTTVCHGGTQMMCEHYSPTMNCLMRFSIFIPPHTPGEKFPLVFFLNDVGADDTWLFKHTDVQLYAQLLRMVIVSPDTSPRGYNFSKEAIERDIGVGASWYVDPTNHVWAGHFRMQSYIALELKILLEVRFSCIDPKQAYITGLGMGGNGSIVTFLRNPGLFKAASALGPFTSPSKTPFGSKCFKEFFGNDYESWRMYDATELVKIKPQKNSTILIDFGLEDKFLGASQPMNFVTACLEVQQPYTLLQRPGYDHSYYYVKTYIGDHLRYFSNMSYYEAMTQSIPETLPSTSAGPSTSGMQQQPR